MNHSVEGGRELGSAGNLDGHMDDPEHGEACWIADRVADFSSLDCI